MRLPKQVQRLSSLCCIRVKRLGPAALLEDNDLVIGRAMQVCGTRFLCSEIWLYLRLGA